MYSNKINTSLFLVLLSVTCIYATCRKHPLDCSRTVANFELGIKAYPNLDSIHLNDTIWVEVDEPTVLTDISTGKSIDYSGASNLGSAIWFEKVSPTTGQFITGVVDRFNFFLVKGINVTNTAPDIYKEYFFAEENGRYVFKVGVIPKEKGIFGLVFSNASSVIRKNDNCTKASFVLNFKNTNQHYYLNPNYTGGPVAPGGAYYFKVY